MWFFFFFMLSNCICIFAQPPRLISMQQLPRGPGGLNGGPGPPMYPSSHHMRLPGPSGPPQGRMPTAQPRLNGQQYSPMMQPQLQRQVSSNTVDLQYGNNEGLECTADFFLFFLFNMWVCVKWLSNLNKLIFCASFSTHKKLPPCILITLNDIWWFWFVFNLTQVKKYIYLAALSILAKYCV